MMRIQIMSLLVSNCNTWLPNNVAASITVCTPMLQNKKANKYLFKTDIFFICSQTFFNSINPFVKILFALFCCAGEFLGSRAKVICANPIHHNPTNKKERRAGKVLSFMPNHAGFKTKKKQAI